MNHGSQNVSKLLQYSLVSSTFIKVWSCVEAVVDLTKDDVYVSFCIVKGQCRIQRVWACVATRAEVCYDDRNHKKDNAELTLMIWSLSILQGLMCWSTGSQLVVLLGGSGNFGGGWKEVRWPKGAVCGMLWSQLLCISFMASQ